MANCLTCIHQEVCKERMKIFNLSSVACQYEAHELSGEWQFVQRGKFVDMVCPGCGFIREEGIAYNLTVEEVLDSIAEDFRVHGKSGFPKYCENCGAKMCVRVKAGDKDD